jgi:hypothetical protein
MSKQPEPNIPQHLWTYPEAVSALPYLRGVARSLRQHWLEVQRARLQVRRIDARPGRPDRQALILRAEAARDVEWAGGALEETLQELKDLDVHCLDPAQGLALIPFRQGDELAWFVFDLFAPKGIEAWRLDADPPETRRALGEALDPAWREQLRAAAVDILMSRATQADDRANLGGMPR